MDNFNLLANNTNDNFIINDIKLYVDPTAISIHKENLEYSFRTLRSKGSTKVASGNGAFHVQVNITFSPEMVIQLHRLITQIRNIPFIYIENKFIQDSMGIPLSNDGGKFFTVFGCSVNNHPSSPFSFVCQLDLRYFNTKPYSNNIKYISDYIYESKTSNYINKYVHGVYEDNRVLYSTKAYDKKSNVNGIEKNRYNEIYNSIKKGENPYKKISYTTVDNPYHSSAYIRYSNYIQYQALKDNFGIFFENLSEVIPPISDDRKPKIARLAALMIANSLL